MAAQTSLDEGDTAYAVFDNRAAIAAYTEAYESHPTDFEVLWRLSRTYNDLAQDRMAAGDKKTAEALFEEAVNHAEALAAAYPDSAQSHFFLAASYGNLALFKGGKRKVELGRAVEEYALRSIALDSTYALPHVALGIFYREVSELSWVLRTFANALFGGLPKGSKEDAVYHLSRAMALDPTLHVAPYELARTYALMKEKEEAIGHFEHTLTLSPHNTQDQRNQADAEAQLAKLRK